MKNWIIVIVVLILPLMTYFVLEKTHKTTAIEAQAKTLSDRPAIVKFASPMCLDCKKLESVMLEVMPSYDSKINYIKVNTQSNDFETSAMIKKYNVSLVPTLVFVKKDGTVYKRTEGFLAKNEVVSLIEALLQQ